MNVICIVAATYKQVLFFSRMKESFEKKNIKMVIITIQYSALRFLSRRGIEAFIPDISKGENESCLISDFFECKIDKMSYDDCVKLFKSTKFLVRNIVNQYNVIGFFIFNGETVECKGAIEIAKECNKELLFFEIANLPGKVFVDKQGVNAHSELCDNPSILKHFDNCHYEYIAWKKNFLDSRHGTKVPQTRNNLSDISSKNIYDVIGFCVLHHVGYSYRYIIKKLKIFLDNCFSQFDYDNYNYKQGKYIFFPLQVTYDTQVIINSNIDIFKALEYVIKRAEILKKDIVIKPHPQEADSYITNVLKKLRQEHDLFVVNDNVMLIMENADEVVTINSTVGLEAKILGKNVNILGNAIYKNFKDDDLEKYICRYLIDVDFWEEYSIDISVIEVLLARLNNQYSV